MATKKTASKSTALTKALPISPQMIERRIFLIRGHKVMLDSDLAELYEVETRTLNQAVRRNIDRFPEDFMFDLSAEEAENLRSQIVISSSGQGYGGRRYTPLVFTEQGVAMLSSVLRSDRAILVNIAIMRAFVRLRELLSTHVDLARKLEDLERKYDGQFKIVFQAIKELMKPPLLPEKPKKQIGFQTEKSK
jgi:hypothetical protein